MHGTGSAERRRGAAMWRLLVVLALVPGCAAKLSTFRIDGHDRFHHRELGYEVDRPSVLDLPDWRRVEQDGLDLVVRAADGSAFALATSCRKTRANPRQLARQLMRTTGATRVGEGETLEQAGLPGYGQDLERVERGAWVRLRTVTLRGARCTYDWMLVAPDADRLAALRPAFDAWWRSFVPAAAELPIAEPAS